MRMYKLTVGGGLLLAAAAVFGAGPPARGVDGGSPVKASDEATPLDKLVADLSSDDGAKRAAATKELFQRGNDASRALKEAGAKQIAPVGGTIDGTRRLDVVYSLLEGLPPNAPKARAGYRADGFGLHVEKGTTKEDAVAMGKRYGFTLGGEFSDTTRPNCYVVLAPGKTLAEVLKDLFSNEPKVVTINLNYYET